MATEHMERKDFVRVSRVRVNKARVRQAQQKLAIFVAFALVVQLVTQLFVAPSSHAAGTIGEQLITEAKLYDQKPTETGGVFELLGTSLDDPNYRVDLANFYAVIFKWELPDGHSYGAGDTYEFKIPEQFKQIPIQPGQLTGGVGTYAVSGDTVTFTFNDSIAAGQGYEGYFYVWMQFEKNKLHEGLEQIIDFQFNGVAPITVQFANKADGNPTKTGIPTKGGFNSDKIDWTVDINKKQETIVDAVLADVLQNGQTLDGSSVQMCELVVLVDGTVKESAAPCVPVTATPTADGFSLSLNTIDKAYRLKYSTLVPAPTSGNFDNVDFGNTVKLSGTGTPEKTAVGSAKISFNKPLTKKAIGYDEPTQTIKWKVSYNYNQQTILQANAWLEDEFTAAGQELVSGSVKVSKVTLGQDGKPTGSTPIDPAPVTLKGVGTGFEDGLRIEFNADISEAYDIEYETKAKERVFAGRDIENKVTMYGGTEAKDKQRINEIIFSKRVNKEDFQAKTIEWELTVNRDKHPMTNIVIADNYAGRNMELDDTSVKVQTNGAGPWQSANDAGFTLSADTNYATGFTLTRADTTSNTYTIRYTTSFDPKLALPSNDKVYKNVGKMTWDEYKDEHDVRIPLTKEAWVTPETYTMENGFKKGEYNPSTKEITWTIYVNYNLYAVTDAIVKDAYTGNQNFVPGSLTVNKLVLDPNKNKVDVGAAVTPVDFQLNADGKGFVLKLGTITDAHQIQYKTSLEGNFPIEGTYSNHATLEDGDGGTQLFEKSAVVTPKHGGEYVFKEGKQIPNSDVAAWKVYINRSQSYVEAGSVVTDTLSDNQILKPESIKLYKAVVPTNNTAEITRAATPIDASGFDPVSGDYELVVNGNTYTLKFKKELREPYILEYESVINAGHGEKIENEAKFSGQSSSAIGQSNEKEIVVSMGGAAGGAATGRGKLKIVKKDDLNQPLAGVEFELSTASGTFLEKVVTDANGVAETVRSYRFHDTAGLPYKLKELSAPSGYLLDPGYAAGKTIDFKGNDVPIEVTNKIIRQGFELVKFDSAVPTEKLEGAKFELRDASGTPVGMPLTTGPDGKIGAGDLPAGNYTLVEIEAPEFYELDPTPIPLTIVANQTEIVKLTKGNVRGSGGSLVVTKVNFKDHTDLLEGVEFELRGVSNAIVKTGTTDVNGVVEFNNLPYGNYKLTETKADGFVIEQPVTDVSINKATTPLLIENKKNDRSVKLTKFDSSKTQVLQGARFELRSPGASLDLEGNPIYEPVTGIDPAKLITDVTGILTLTDLPTGKYRLIEISAPSGYRLDSTPVDFEITTTQTEAKLVEKLNERSSGGGGWIPPTTPEPSPSPKPTPSPEPTTTPEPTPSPSPSVTPEPTQTPEPSPSPTPGGKEIKEETTVDKPVKGEVDVPKGGKTTIVEQPEHGKVEITPDGKWKYTPDKGYKGKDSFKIKVVDKDGNEEEVLVDIDVDDVPRGGVDPDGKTPGKSLPKTGEGSSLPFRIAGLALVALGVLFLNRNRLLRLNK